MLKLGAIYGLTCTLEKLRWFFWMLLDGSKFMDIEEKCPCLKEEPHTTRISLAENSGNPFGELTSI